MPTHPTYRRGFLEMVRLRDASGYVRHRRRSEVAFCLILQRSGPVSFGDGSAFPKTVLRFVWFVGACRILDLRSQTTTFPAL